MMRPFDEKTQTQLFYITILATGILLAAFAALYFMGIKVTDLISECVFYTKYHLSCPGCGGTRAVICLLHGDILRSLLYHPFVLYGAVIYSFFMVSNILYSLSISKRRYALRPIHFWAAAAIILIQCLLKNIYFDEWVRMTT